MELRSVNQGEKNFFKRAVLLNRLESKKDFERTQ